MADIGSYLFRCQPPLVSFSRMAGGESRATPGGRGVAVEVARPIATRSIPETGNEAISKFGAPGHVRGVGLLTDGFELHPLGAD